MGAEMGTEMAVGDRVGGGMGAGMGAGVGSGAGMLKVLEITARPPNSTFWAQMVLLAPSSH